MSWARRIAAVLLILVGVGWILQGVNLLPGSFMSGRMEWAYIGIVVALAGLALFFVRGRANGQGDDSGNEAPPSGG